MYRFVVVAVALAAAGFSFMPRALADDSADADVLARGRYIALVGGCNDCHTPGFAESGGVADQSTWLTGDHLGWQGPWGTTYARNLRLFFAGITEDQWVEMAPKFRARPPMPFWAVNAMHEDDLRALYRFVRSLGTPGAQAPEFAPPGQAVTTPVVVFPAPPPAQHQ